MCIVAAENEYTWKDSDMATYKDAGVDVEAGDEAVNRIKRYAERTFKFAPGKILGGIGGFSGLIKLADGKITAYATDGVGIKLLVAIAMDKHDTVGQDLVAMCVNDIACSGVPPRVFLDYIAMGKQMPERTEAIVKGVADACVKAEIVLIGGEMAEMPGMYHEDHYDLAGFAFGFTESCDDLILGDQIKPGMQIWGRPSSGIHSNGLSLVREIFRLDHEDVSGTRVRLERCFSELDTGRSLGEELLTPTSLYSSIVRDSVSMYEILGFAHITGGGLSGNIPRILPNGCAAQIKNTAWKWPPIFSLIQREGGIEPMEMLSTFNCGVGLVAISPDDLSSSGWMHLGEVVATGDEPHVQFG